MVCVCVRVCVCVCVVSLHLTISTRNRSFSNRFLYRIIFSDCSNAAASANALLCARQFVCRNFAVLWLNVQMDRVIFWYDDHHRGQLLCTT